MSERLIDALRRGTRPFQRNPHMERVLMITGGSTDPFTSETYGSFSKGVARVMGGALEGLDPDESARILRVVNAVWYANLLVNGRSAIAGVYETLEQAAHLLLDHRDAERSVSPTSS